MTREEAGQIIDHLTQDFGGVWMVGHDDGHTEQRNAQEYTHFFTDVATGQDGPIEVVGDAFKFVIDGEASGARHYRHFMRFPSEAQARAAYTSWLILSAGG